MKSIVRKPVASAIGFAAILFFSFAAPAQTPSAGAAKNSDRISSLPERWARSIPIPLPSQCFCDAQCLADLRRNNRFFSVPAYGTDYPGREIPTIGSDGLRKFLEQEQQKFQTFPKRRPPYLNHENEIQVIDFDGLKKFLERDPKDTRPLLINFWATWCDSCREEFPDLVKIDQDYREKGLNFVAISLDDVSDIKTKVVDFLKEVRARMPVIVLNVPDADSAIHFVDPTWGGEMPATFLYDKDGKVVFKYFGKVKPDELRAAIDKQLAVSNSQKK